MSREIREYQFTIPPGTPLAAPITQSIAFPPRVVDKIQFTVPPGPFGFMGFAIAAAGVPIIPYNPGGWIVTNDEKAELDIDGYIDSGAWQAMGYNTGIYPHTVYLRFFLSLVTPTSNPIPQVISSDLLGSS